MFFPDLLCNRAFFLPVFTRHGTGHLVFIGRLMWAMLSESHRRPRPLSAFRSLFALFLDFLSFRECIYQAPRNTVGQAQKNDGPSNKTGGSDFLS